MARMRSKAQESESRRHWDDNKKAAAYVIARVLKTRIGFPSGNACIEKLGFHCDYNQCYQSYNNATPEQVEIAGKTEDLLFHIGQALGGREFRNTREYMLGEREFTFLDLAVLIGTNGECMANDRSTHDLSDPLQESIKEFFTEEAAARRNTTSGRNIVSSESSSSNSSDESSFGGHEAADYDDDDEVSSCGDSTAAVAASPEKCGSPTSSAPEAKPASSMRTTVPPLPGKFNADKENEANTTFVEATPAAAQKKNAMSSPKPYDKALTGGQKVSPRLTRSAHKRAQTKQAMDSLALLKNNSSSSSDDDDEEVQNPRPKSVEFHQFNRYDEWEQQRTAKRARHSSSSSSSSSSSATNHEDLEQMTPDQVRRITTEKLQGSKVSDSIQQLLECVAMLELEIKKKEKLLKQMNETKDSLEVQLGQSRDENGVLVKQIQELKGRIEEVKGGELKESQQQLGDMAVENGQTSAKLEQKENEFLQAVDNMEVESKKKVAIESKLTSVSSQKESLLSENESLAMELNVVKDQTSQLQHQATFIDLTESSSDEEMSIDESDESDDNEFSDSEEAVDNTTGSESAEVQMARTYHVVNFNGNTAEQQLISHAGKAPKAGAVQRTELKISNSGSLKIAPASEITRKDIVNADGMVLWVSKCDENGLEYKILLPRMGR